MAMSRTMSNPSDWLQFYNQSLPDHQVSEATAVTAVTASAATASQFGSGNPSSSTNSLSPEGRVSKPVRKRSRASRRTPTTLLNTDTANFRAMVQQFTGGPSTTSFPAGPSNFSFGHGPARQGFVNPTGSVMVHQGYNPLQQQLQQQQQQQQQQHQQPYQQYLLSLNNNYPQTMSSATSAARVVGPTSMGVLSDDHDHQAGFLREAGGGGGSSRTQVGGAAAGGGGGSGRPNSNPSNENRMSSSFMF